MTESRPVYVTDVQILAAQEIVARAERFGREVDPAVVKIANARRASPAELEKQTEPTA